MLEFDTIVIGGGIVGTSTADALLRKGEKVLLIEQFDPGHTRGSSHGDGRIIRFAYAESLYVQMAQLAYPAWEQLAQRTGKRFVIPTGGWDCGPDDSVQLAELEANFRHFGIPYERLTANESNKRFPQFHLPEGSAAIYQADAGVVKASAAVLALWDLIEAQGGATLKKTRVTEIETTDNQVTVRTSEGTYVAPRVVIATGSWSQKVLAQTGLALPLVPTQELVAYFAAADGVDHRVGAMPVFIDYHSDDAFYGLPQVDVPGVKVGWHHTGPVLDPDYPEAVSNEAQLTVRVDALKTYIAKRFPHLDSTQTVQVTTCLYTNTPDYHFVLDRHPTHPNIVIGTGFSGHGFKFGPILGELLASLVVEESPALPLDMFAIARFEQMDKLVKRTNA
jgi:N-methyl-L-tryptophan oxidase